jgi:hypothetical protein
MLSHVWQKTVALSGRRTKRRLIDKFSISFLKSGPLAGVLSVSARGPNFWHNRMEPKEGWRRQAKRQMKIASRAVFAMVCLVKQQWKINLSAIHGSRRTVGVKFISAVQSGEGRMDSNESTHGRKSAQGLRLAIKSIHVVDRDSGTI